MSTSETLEPLLEGRLEAQLEMLQTVDVTASAQRIQKGIQQRVRQKRRQVILASLGAGVAAIATLHFTLRGDSFAFLAMAPVTALFVFTAWRSAHQAAGLAGLKSGSSMLASWRAALRSQMRQTLIAQLIALEFVALTGYVVWYAGLLNYKAFIFLTATTGILVYAAYQFLVVRRSLKRELDMLGQDG